jgi:ankyrin repeat protein
LRTSIATLLTAILKDDRPQVKSLLKADRELTTGRIAEPHLYESEIYHWMYAGDTALHLAAAGYRVEIVRMLLAAGADPNAAANHRRSGPLHYAADGFITGPAWNADRQLKTIRCLLEAGSEIHAQDKNGATPLHRAVRTRCAAAVQCLLQAGADPTVRNKSGSMPFHLAVQNTGRGGSGEDEAKTAQRQIIEAFLSAGLCPEFKDGKGKSVLDCAKSGWARTLLTTNGPGASTA